MKLNEVKFSFEETFGDLMLIGNPKEVYAYDNGKRSDVLEAIGYPVISSKTWDKMNVKVKEKISSIEFAGNPIPVTFTNIDAKLWQDFKSNEIKVSVTADSVRVVQNKLKMNRGQSNEV